MRPMTKKQRILLAYLKDWLLVILMTAVFVGIDQLPTYNRLFSLEDRTIQFTYTEHERVPIWLLLIIAGLTPFLIITSIAIYNRKLLDFHHGTLGLTLALSLTVMFTDVVKITVGRPRPDFIDRCQPKNGSHDAPVYGLSSSAICTWTDPEIIKDAYRSLPSGHSSFAFAGMTFLALFLGGKLHVFDSKSHSYKSFVVTAPFIVAALVAVSRTQDYRHHWQDVIAGGILGIVLALFSYLQYYPPPWLMDPHLPFKHNIYYDQDELLPDTASGNTNLIPSDTRV